MGPAGDYSCDQAVASTSWQVLVFQKCVPRPPGDTPRNLIWLNWNGKFTQCGISVLLRLASQKWLLWFIQRINWFPQKKKKKRINWNPEWNIVWYSRKSESVVADYLFGIYSGVVGGQLIYGSFITPMALIIYVILIYFSSLCIT